MQVRNRKDKLEKMKTALFVLPLFRDEALPAEFKALPFPIEAALKGNDFKAKKGEQLLLLPSVEKSGIQRVMLLGMGSREKFSLKVLTAAYGSLFIHLRNRSVADVTVELPLTSEEGPSPVNVALTLARACRAGSYQFENYKSEPRKLALKKLAYRAGEKPLKAVTDAFLRGDLIGQGVNTARDLSNEPGATATPTYLSTVAKSYAKGAKSVTVKVLGEPQLKKLGAGGILAVGQGSREESRMIVMEYKSGRKNAPRLAVIGKGLTFDAGGISLKPGSKMEDMKFDMCGSAAVLGLFSVIADLKPNVDVIGVVPSAENLPDGAAYKPGDIITLLCGKTVEIINTDAEGRLLLCDALTYAEKTYKPDAMIDFATLTGAVLVAFGHEMSAVMGNDAAMVEAVVDAGSKSGDRCWPMPLADEYKAMIESPIADIRNSTNTRDAGTITAGAFLDAAVQDTPWAHVDIAGTAWMPKKAGYISGPSGVGVHLLVDLLETFEA
jgi:leucyl aminopeptidase